MIEEVIGQTKLNVGIERLWNALAKDLIYVIPKAIPNFVKHVEVVEGDGGIGTVYLFTFASDVTNMTYQKEKIVELDESQHQIGIQVIEGGKMNIGFSSYKTILQLSTSQSDDDVEDNKKTIVNVKISYEYKEEDDTMPTKQISSTLAFIRDIESYLLNVASD